MHGFIRLLSGLTGAVAGLVTAITLLGLVLVPTAALAEGHLAGAAGLPIALMLWLALAGCGLAAVVGAMAGWRLAHRWLGPVNGVPPELMCTGCGYNLRGSASAKCPECGQPIGSGQQQAIAATRSSS